MQGRNGTVFYYGATGAGKTYTMLGTMENPEVMVLAMNYLFSKVTQKNHSIKLSYLEIYNETVSDLLSHGSPLNLREDKQAIVAASLTQRNVYSMDEVVIEYRSLDGVNVKRVGKLSLIDLAGSERALATDQRTQRSIEGANINRSLLAFSSCISALVEGKKHIPYRNSKLTQLLKDSTQQTTVNEEVLDQPDSESMLVLELQKENRVLREQLAKQQHKLLTAKAQLLTSKTSPQRSPAPLSHVSTPGSTQRKTRQSILAGGGGNYFSTLDSKRHAADNAQVRELQRKVSTLEPEIKKMKKEHLLQLKRKDDEHQRQQPFSSCCQRKKDSKPRGNRDTKESILQAASGIGI
ncbi:Kinesin-like protein KIN-8A [Zea mays]|uniref:Kinesin-like protein n=1 Tax=Zea mays TaxID=4577 RepID=A0A3L6FBS3_MAIZE|nr:Kinesin-like protein KIN-8A [Zea mays]